MKFSICIPNYNYGHFIGRAIQSVFDQSEIDLEILVSDNCSTDNSVEVIRGFNDPRIKFQVNSCNVGFAGNLDRAAGMATGDFMILLSSDDVLFPGVLDAFRRLIEQTGDDRAILTSTWSLIDAEDNVTGESGPPTNIWFERDRAEDLEQAVGGPVYRVACDELLRRSLLGMTNPFNFSSTCYPRQLYKAVEGYGGGRLINPDKWFHWKLMSVGQNGYFVDRPLVGYRWHNTNQTALQAGVGALKFSVDEYVSTLEVDQKWLDRLGLTRQQLIDAFVEHDVARHGLATLARGERLRAQRILMFGRAVYPDAVRRNRKAKALRMLLSLGPVGQQIAQRAYKSYLQKNQKEDVSNAMAVGSV
jgi:glycosyltransferase involved in cell wall biosynthesis